VLILGEADLEIMKRHGAEGYPEEVCGLLVGSSEPETGVRRILEVRRAANRARNRQERYDLDPYDHRRIEEEARQRNLEVVGVYHSHADHPSDPSETDRRLAGDIWQSSESWSYLILEVTAGRAASWKSWVLREGIFLEEPVEVSAEPHELSEEGARE
jgi:proteasome lid subunit RPN8/RPN11